MPRDQAVLLRCHDEWLQCDIEAQHTVHSHSLQQERLHIHAVNHGAAAQIHMNHAESGHKLQLNHQNGKNM